MRQVVRAKEDAPIKDLPRWAERLSNMLTGRTSNETYTSDIQHMVRIRAKGTTCKIKHAHFETVGDAASVTLAVTRSLEGKLSLTALKLYRALHTVAVDVAAARGYSPGVSEVVLFCPAEAVALALGVHRCTVYRWLPELRDAGLVDMRAHYCTHQGRTRADGTVWAVRLRPFGGRKARVGHSDLKHSYRNLSGDIKAGNTVWEAMRQSKSKTRKPVEDLSYMRRWSLSNPDQNHVKVDCRMAGHPSLEALLDVTYAERSERSAAVNSAAQAIATALADRSSTDFHRKLLWQLLRRYDATGEDHFQAVYQEAKRAAEDMKEGFPRRAGALFVSRVQRARWWDELMNGSGPGSGGPARA